MTQHSSLAPMEKTGTDLKLVSAHEVFEHTQNISDLIARRAYEIFERRGRADGNDQADWFLAESEIVRPVKCRILESDDHLIAHAQVPGFRPHEIKVSIEPHRLRIGGRAEASENRSNGEAVMYSLGHSLLPAKQIFHVAELPTAVDPSKAKVTFKEGLLEIVMPKAVPTKRFRAETREIGAIEAAGISPIGPGAHGPVVKAHTASSKR